MLDCKGLMRSTTVRFGIQRMDKTHRLILLCSKLVTLIFFNDLARPHRQGLIGPVDVGTTVSIVWRGGHSLSRSGKKGKVMPSSV
jgi:hypothetical protein